jgi:5-methylcytosine-specific restriction protein A
VLEDWREESARKRADGEYETFYKSPAWRNLRQWKIRHDPTCELCGQPTEMVDHIIPIKLGGEKLDEENLQSLCDTCHAKKRAKEAIDHKQKMRMRDKEIT